MKTREKTETTKDVSLADVAEAINPQYVWHEIRQSMKDQFEPASIGFAGDRIGGRRDIS
jgi:hypothetical protein